jgi:hypothetical protein
MNSIDRPLLDAASLLARRTPLALQDGDESATSGAPAQTSSRGASSELPASSGSGTLDFWALQFYLVM